MNKKILIGIFMAVLLVGTALVGTTAEAANGQAKGLYGFPGNSLYGRMHNPHFMYKWGNEEFESIDELLEYIREYMETWKKLHGKGGSTGSSDVNVITRSAIDIDEDEATLRGQIELDDNESAEVWFEYGTRSSDLSKKTEKLDVDDEDADTFSSNVTDLKDDTRYYFRVVARDEDGKLDRGTILSFITDEDGSSDDEGEPEISTLSAQEVDGDEAQIRGTIDMNDFEDGLVFFVYGIDEDVVSDIDDEDEYADIDEDGDDLQKVKVDDSFDGSGTWEYDLTDLDDDTTYYYRIGVEYEDEDDDTVLLLGNTKSFTTDEDGSSDDEGEPEISTLSAQEVDSDEAQIRGTVDMNDFEDGLVFFVYGTDDDAVSDVADEDEYADITEDGDDLQKLKMDDNFDGSGTWEYDLVDLDDNTTYYYSIGLEYEDEDGDTVLLLGTTRSFATE